MPIEAKPIAAALAIASTLAVALWDTQMLRGFGQQSAFAVPAALALRNQLGKADSPIAAISTETFNSTGAHVSFIARLVRVRIVAEVTEPEEFLKEEKQSQKSVLTSLSRAGAEGVLLYAPQIRPDSSWMRLASTDYYFRRLDANH